MPELILKEEVYLIVGAAMDVYYQLGRGFLEPIYQEALEIELQRRKIPFEPQQWLTTYYKGQALEKKYKPDLICYGQIIAAESVRRNYEQGSGPIVELSEVHSFARRSVAQLWKPGQARMEEIRDLKFVRVCFGFCFV